MTMLDKIKKLCDDRNTTIAALERDLDFAQASIRKWNESPPSIKKVAAVAEYFGVSIDYLVGADDTENDDVNEILQELYSNPEYRILCSTSMNLKKESLVQLKQIVDTFKPPEDI